MAKSFLTGRMVGAETIVGDIRRYGETIRSRLRAEVERSARELVVAARAKAPKRTGALASSISAEGMETEKKIMAKVGSSVFYSRFLESGWTPNPSRKLANTKSMFGPYGPSVVSVQRASWKRNPRNAREWKAFSASNGPRKIHARPFLKPAIASLRGRIRERLIAAVNREP